MKYDFADYNDIPENLTTFILNVAGLESLDEISIEDINMFLNETEEVYAAGGTSINDFLE